VLADIAPLRAPAGYRELRLPAPIPGTFESFDATPEGQLPPGWSARHEPVDAPPLGAAAERLDLPESNVFEDWTAVSWDRVVASASASGPPYFPSRLLARGSRERLGGGSASQTLQGRFLYALSGDRGASGVQYVLTPEYDLSGRAGVHVVFHSATVQGGGSITALEYTVDGGAS
jgi:hypothetical protein